MASKNKQSIKLEADVTGFKKNVKEAEKSITSLNSVLKLNKAQLSGNGNSTQTLSERLDILKQKYQEQSTAIENAEKAYKGTVELLGENSKEAETLSKKIIELKTSQQRTANEIDKTNKQLIIQSEKFISAGQSIQKFGNNISSVGDKINSAGNKLSILSAGVATVAGASLKASISFESAWAGVTKTVEGTEEQMKNLRDGILKLSTQLPSAATEIAAVAENAGQLGIQTDNVLSFSKAMIDLGNSTNLTADEASSQLAKFANIMQMSQSDFDKLGSSIVDLGNNFATTEADIVNMAMRLAGAGHQVGMSEGQVLGLATALSSVGIEAEMGGSAISKAMVKMQNAVEQGGTKLDVVLKKTGMTLRDLELMAANDSKSFKEVAQSIGMTSTEIKQLITAGTNLEDFSKVSGMTTEQFKKAWKEDAAGALSAFIKGLGDAETKGESAITMLSEMGLTEVRLRDSLLRAANAGDLFNNALSTGTKAWNENVALANEANKRYETTESKLKMLKNEIIANGIALGDELKPTLVEVLELAKPIIANVASMVKSFNNLSTTTKKNVIGFGAMVVAAGPTVKIGGKIISTTGNMVKGYGSLIEKVGKWSAGLKIATTTEVASTTAKKAQTVATTSSTVATTANTGATVAQTTATTAATVATKLLKAAMIGLPIIGVIAGIASLVATYKEMNNETLQTSNKIKEQKEEMEQLREEQQREMESNLAQIDNTKRLKEELSTLVDENGKIKDGYEARAKFILGELNNALGTEYSATDGVIAKYNELSGSIDNLILKKKANIILEAKEERYKTAINEKTKAVELLTQKQDELTNKEKEIAEIRNEILELDDKEDRNSRAKRIAKKARIEQLEKEKQAMEDNCKTQSEVIQTYINDITDYETNAALVAEGTQESLNKVTEGIVYNQKKVSDSSVLELQTQINTSATYLQQLEDNYKETGSEITKKQIEEEKKRLESLTASLIEQTSTTEEMTPELVAAWKTLATLSYDEYSAVISNMEPDMQEKIQKATEVIVNGTPYAGQVASEYGKTIVQNLDKNEEFRRQAISSLNAYLSGLTDEEQKELIKQAGVKDVDKVMEGLREGKKLSEEQGVEILKGLETGLKNNKWQNSIFGVAGGIASKLTSAFSIKASSVASTGKLPGHKDGLNYVPYDNYVARLHKGERVLTAKENKEYMNGNINNKAGTTNITLNFYPQKMTDDEIDRAKAKIEKDWGVKV